MQKNKTNQVQDDIPELDFKLAAARRFLKILDRDATEFTFQTFDNDASRKDNSLARRPHGSLDQLAPELKSLQEAGAGVYVMVNEGDGKGRSKENVTRVRAVFVDGDGQVTLEQLKDFVPKPHVIVKSSPGHYQAYWLVEGLPVEQFEGVQRAIADTFGTDSVVDRCRVMRVPGFYHQKDPARPYRVWIVHANDLPPYEAKRILRNFPPVGRPTTEFDESEWGELPEPMLPQVFNQEVETHPKLLDLAKHENESKRDFGFARHACERGWSKEKAAAFIRTARDIYGDQKQKVDDPRYVWRTIHNAYSASTLDSHLANPTWPDPLSEDALHGLAGDVVRDIGPHSEADPASILFQFLAAFGNACGRSHYVQVEADRHPPQIWPVLVGETAKARKGTSLGRVQELFTLADPAWATKRMLSGLSSGEGVLWQVRDPNIKLSVDKKTGECIDQIEDPGEADKRLFVTEPEFASVLRHMERPGNTLSGTLRCLWDRGDVQALTKNSPTRTTGSMVTVVGHVTVDELKRYLTRTEMANGLANRFLFACVRRSKALPFGGRRVDVTPFADRIAERLEQVRDRERFGDDTEVGWTRDAQRLWVKAYRELSEGKPGMLGAVTARAEAQTLRLALVYALLDGVEDLKPAHIRAALAVWKYCEQSATFMFGTTLGDPTSDEIYRVLRDSPDGLTRTDIRNLFGRNKGATEIGVALNLLLQRGHARCEQRATAGRPEERWFATYRV